MQHPVPRKPGLERVSFKESVNSQSSIAGMKGFIAFEEFEPREFIAQGDKVVVNVFERARSKAGGPFFDNDYVHIYTVRDGKITALRIFEETAPIHAVSKLADDSF